VLHNSHNIGSSLWRNEVKNWAGSGRTKSPFVDLRVGDGYYGGVMSQPLDGLRSLFPVVAATHRDFADYVLEEDIQRVLDAIVEAGYSRLGKACYIRGMGHQPRSVYSKLEHIPGIRVVNYESLLPPGLRFIPSHRGLVKIDDSSKLPAVFNELTAQSMATIYVFDSSLEASFVDAVRHADARRDQSFGVKQDPGYLIYYLDEDRDDSPTGMVQFLSYDGSGPWGEIIKRDGPSSNPSRQSERANEGAV
jgi:hypothetical protein